MSQSVGMTAKARTQVSRCGQSPGRSFSSWALLVVLLSLGCTEDFTGTKDPVPGAPPPRLVLLYSTCTLNKSFLSPYNTDVGYTPHLERLSREGQVFTKHRTEAGSSGIAFASIFSGSQANHHGVFSHPSRLDDSVELISEAFASNGYEGFFWDHHPMASADLNYGQGIPPANVFRNVLRAEDPRFLKILKKLRDNPQYKAFVVTTFTVTHAPYRDRREDFCREYPTECDIQDLPEAWVSRHLELFAQNKRRFQANLAETAEQFGLSKKDIVSLARLLEVLYRSNVFFLDRIFGDVIERIRTAGVLDEAVIVFTADHGEAMYDANDHRHWTHGATLQTETLDVPLIIRAPGQWVPPGRAEYVTRSMDVFPTIAGLAGLSLPDEMRTTGVDLTEVIRGEEPPPALDAFSHTGVVKAQHLEEHAAELGRMLDYFTGAGIEETWVALRQGDTVCKYRHIGGGEWRFQAYHLANDPTEDHDIYDPTDASHRAMAKQLQRYKAALVEAHAEWETRLGESLEELSNDELRRLRSLGYIR